MKTLLVYYSRTGNTRMIANTSSKRSRAKIVEASWTPSCAPHLAVPGPRKNSMNAHTFPGYVLGLVKDKGQPLQLVNAFKSRSPARTD